MHPDLMIASLANHILTVNEMSKKLPLAFTADT